MLEAWWARQGLNLRPLRCEHSALPLSYAPTPGRRERRSRWCRGDFCPSRGNDILLFGPYSGDRPGLKEAFRDPSRNAFVYVAYLKPYAPARAASPGYEAIKGYDLRTDTRDLCLRLRQVGYFVTPSRSNEIVVPRAAIARALGLPK